MPSRFVIRLMILAVWLVGACGGSTPKVETSGMGVVARKSTPLKRFECKGDRDSMIDSNGDGYANIRHVFDGATETCTELDLNFDGGIDMTRLWKGGVVDQEQHDFDFDGRLDEQSFYENGKLVRKELD